MDVNDNNRTAVGTALQQDNLLIQSTADLNILSLAIVPDTISTGQTGIAGQMIYVNTGSAPIRVNSTQLFTTPQANDFVSGLIGKTTPFTIQGNKTDTLNYIITAPASLAGDVTVNGVLNRNRSEFGKNFDRFHPNHDLSTNTGLCDLWRNN